MTDATKRAEDFFAANPGQQYMATRGAIHTSDGRMLRPSTEGSSGHRIRDGGSPAASEIQFLAFAAFWRKP